MTQDRTDPTPASEDEPVDEDLGRLFAAAAQLAPLDPEDRRRSLETVAQFEADRRRGAWRRWMMGGVAVATACAAGFLLWRSVPRPTAATEISPYTVARGSLTLDGVVLEEGESVPIDRWLVPRGRACVRVPGGTGCAEAASRLRVHDAKLELESGTLELVGSAAVTLGAATVRTIDGECVVSIEGEERFVLAHRGTVELTEAGSVVVVPVGERYDLGRPPVAATPQPADSQAAVVPEDVVNPEPVREAVVERLPPRQAASASVTSNPGDFLVEARAHVASGNVGPALAAYRALQRRHPQSAEAQAANVSIGKLELQRGRARAALRAFEKYMRKGGTLAAEARWGTIRAHHQLGDVRRRDEAIEALRVVDPKSVYLRRAQAL